MLNRFFFILVFFMFLTPNVFAIDVSYNCPLDGSGKVDRAEFTSAAKICFAPATNYAITYEAMALCTTNPETEMRAGRDLDNVCHFVHKTTDTPIDFTLTNSASTSFAATIPQVGTYTHALAITKNEYTIAGEIEFNGTIYGTNEARNALGGGNFCGPPTGSYKISSFYSDTLTGATLLAACYATSKGASPQSGTLIADSLSIQEFDADIVGLGVLLNSAGNVATNEASVTSYANSYEFASPFTVTASTTSLTFSVSLDQALRIITQPAGSNVIAYLAYLGDFNLKVEAN